MYYIFLIVIVFFSAFLPVGGAYEISAEKMPYANDFVGDERFDFSQTRVFQVEGHSMESYGFMDGSHVDVVPASSFNVGDAIAFECMHEKCDSAYIKTITKKDGTCYWVEGRTDQWMQDGQKRQSMDSRTTYGWLCDDEIKIYGVAFVQRDISIAM